MNNDHVAEPFRTIINKRTINQRTITLDCGLTVRNALDPETIREMGRELDEEKKIEEMRAHNQKTLNKIMLERNEE